MGKWREETKELSCGCKIGRSGKGPWFYDYYCEEHVKAVQTNGRFDYEKSLKELERMQGTMKALEENARIRAKIPKEIFIGKVRGRQFRLGQHFTTSEGFVTDVTYRFKTEDLMDEKHKKKYPRVK